MQDRSIIYRKVLIKDEADLQPPADITKQPGWVMNNKYLIFWRDGINDSIEYKVYFECKPTVHKILKGETQKFIYESEDSSIEAQIIEVNNM